MSLSVLEEYIETGNHQDLELLLNKTPELVKLSTSQDVSPLLLACYYHKPQVIQSILKYITTITIHEACAVGLKDHVQMMIDHKPEVVDELSLHGFTPLGISSHFNKEELVRLLLKNNADPNIPSSNSYNIYPIHTALSANNTIISKMLIEAGAEINITQQGGITPLHLAAQHGNIELIILLLEAGADITLKTATADTAADLAMQKGFHEIATILKF